MVSVLSPSTLLPLHTPESKISLNEMGTLRDAVEPLTQLLVRSGISEVRLNCTVPTWSPTSDTCLDLHDLHELRSRLLIFIHDAIQSLRSSGISASYRLVPSDSSLCLVCALPPNLSASLVKNSILDAVQSAKVNKRNNVLLADLEYGPCLIIT